jgi:hypothetical protein
MFGYTAEEMIGRSIRDAPRQFGHDVGGVLNVSGASVPVIGLIEAKTVLPVGFAITIIGRMWWSCRGWLDTAACRITGASARRRHGASQNMVRGLGGLLDQDPAYREFRRGQGPPSPHPNPVGSTALPSAASKQRRLRENNPDSIFNAQSKYYRSLAADEDKER